MLLTRAGRLLEWLQGQLRLLVSNHEELRQPVYSYWEVCLKERTLNHSECKIEGPALLLSQGSVTNIYQRQPCYIQIKHQTKHANQCY